MFQSIVKSFLSISPYITFHSPSKLMSNGFSSRALSNSRHPRVLSNQCGLKEEGPVRGSQMLSHRFQSNNLLFIFPAEVEDGFLVFYVFFAKLLQVFFVTGHAQPISSSSSARSAFIGMEAMRGETMTGWTLVWGKMVTLCLFNVAMDKHHFLICPYKSVMFQSYVKSLESARTIRPEFNVRLSALDCSYKML